MQRWLDIISLVIIILGALNWGIIGLFDYDVIAEIAGDQFGELNGFSRTVYVIVGIAGLYQLYPLYRLSMGEEATSARA